jgi:dTDP-L-rhamnose 4-epimerase
VEFIHGDVTQRSDWERALQGVDVVSHQAAYQDYAPDYSHFMATNVVGTAMLFEVIAEKKLPVRRVVVASSQSVYGEGQYRCDKHGKFLPEPRGIEKLERRNWDIGCPKCGTVARNTMLDEAQPNPLSPYGTSKYAQELTALKLGSLLGIPCVALRYSITQGPRQSMFNQYSGIARIFTLRLMRDENPIAFEDGLLQRDYVHVRDVVEANWLVTHDARAVGQAFNVGSGVPTTVLEYANRLASKMGKSIRPKVPGIYRLGDARHSVSSIEKIARLGWRPCCSLDNILEDFLRWVKGMGVPDSVFSDTHQELLQLNVLRVSSAL